MAGAFLVMAAMIFFESRRLSIFGSSLPPQSRSLGDVVEPFISSIAYSLIEAAHQIVRYISIRFLVALHSIASLGRTILTRIEKRFSLLIDAVRGHGHTPDSRHRGSVSFFLEQIKDYKDEMTRRANTRS